MSKVSLIARLTATEGKTDEFRAALATLIEAADSEPGLEVYSANASADDPNTYFFFEVYTDETALGAHGKEEPMRSAMGALGALLSGRPEVTRLSPVVAKGLDL